MMNVHGGDIYEFAMANGLKTEEIIDFSSNVNFLGPSLKAVKAAEQISSRLTCHYPKQTPQYLEKEIADYYNVSPANVFACRGAAEAIFLLTATFRPKRVFIPGPTFTEYVRAANGWGLENFEISESSDYLINLETAVSQATTGDLIWLCRPNNPTGDLVRIQHIADKIFELCSSGVLVASDESFLDFLPSWQDESLSGAAANTSGLMVLGSLSKLHALPSLRVGWIIAHRSLVSRIADSRPPWMFDGFTESVATAALRDSEWQALSRSKNLESKVELLGLLKDSDFILPSDSAANFILAKLTDDLLTPSILSGYLAKNGIMIRTCDDFSGLGERDVRLAVKCGHDQQRLAEVLRKFSHKRSLYV